MKLVKIIDGIGLPFRPVFDRYGLRTSYLGYGGGSHAIKFYYKSEEFEMNIVSNENLKRLAYVHGTHADLLEGNVCVVRCGLETYTEETIKNPLVINKEERDEFTLPANSKIYSIAETQLKSIKTESGKTLIYIGKTQNGNYRIVLK